MERRHLLTAGIAVAAAPVADARLRRRIELVQRDDDDEETVEERLDVFAANTRPVIEYYDEAGALVRIDGEGSPEEVWAALRAAIDDAI